MILQPGADDLPLVVQILRPDEADDAVDQKRLEDPCDSVGPGFERQLIDSVMSLGRESAALPCFEIHHVVPGPVCVPLPMMLKNLFATFTQQIQSDSETAVGRFCTRHGLKKKINGCSAIKCGELSGDMRQATGLGRDL